MPEPSIIDDPPLPRRVPRWLLFVSMIVATWLLFGPMAEFHHQYVFGILGCVLLNGEDPTHRSCYGAAMR
jgi:hypothetical protein